MIFQTDIHIKNPTQVGFFFAKCARLFQYLNYELLVG
jgi:hypothetical protein